MQSKVKALLCGKGACSQKMKKLLNIGMNRAEASNIYILGKYQIRRNQGRPNTGRVREYRASITI